MDEEDFFELIADNIPSQKMRLVDVGVMAANALFQLSTAVANSAELALDALMSHANAERDEHEFRMEAAREIEDLTSPPKE